MSRSPIRKTPLAPLPAPSSRKILEYLPTNSLKPDPENAREHSKAQIKQIAKSIEAFGFGAPILVDRDLKILAGHGRHEALKLIGWSEAPVIRMEHLTPQQARAYAIADNKLTENSKFNQRQLALHFQILAELDLDFDLEATGFSMGEIDLTIEGLNDLDPNAPDPDDQPLPLGPAICRPGDIWNLGQHRIICGSALDEAVYERLLGADKVAAVSNDAPYNVPVHGHISGKGRRRHREFLSAAGEMSGPEFASFLTSAMRLAAAASQPGSVHFWFMDWRHIHALLAVGAATYGELLNLAVWVKNNGGMGSLYRSAHELVAVFRHGDASHRNNVQLGRYGRNRTNVWTYPGANTFLRTSEEADLLAQHPTPKPVALVADALLDVTVRGDLVLDAFLGSGTTLMAAERIGRRCRGIELDPLYIDLAIRRWIRRTGEPALREADGMSFQDLQSTQEAKR